MWPRTRLTSAFLTSAKKNQNLSVSSWVSHFTLFTMCAGGQQTGGSVWSRHYVPVGISREVHSSVCLIAGSNPWRNVLHTVWWVTVKVNIMLTQVYCWCNNNPGVSVFLRYDHSCRSLKPAAGGFELIQKSFCSWVFHVLWFNFASIPGHTPQLHQDRCVFVCVSTWVYQLLDVYPTNQYCLFRCCRTGSDPDGSSVHWDVCWRFSGILPRQYNTG